MNFQYVFWGVVFALVVVSLSPVLSWKTKTVIAVIGLVVLLPSFFLSPAKIITLGPEDWYEKSPWKEVILFVMMIAGMVARTLSQAIEQYRKKLKRKGAPQGLDIDKWDFVYPFLVSFLTFGAIVAQAGAQALSLTTLVFAFQNGFFWQTLIKRESKTA